MAFVSRSMLTPALMMFNMKSSVHARFHSVWPKENIGNIKVYSSTMDMYAGGSWRHDLKFKRFLLSLGMSHDEMTAEKVDKEIERIYFTLDNTYAWNGTVRPSGEYSDTDWNTDSQKYSPTSLPRKPSTQHINDKFNSTFNAGDEVNIRVSYGGGLKRYVGSHQLEWTATGAEIIAGPLDKQAIRDTLASDPWFYYAGTNYDGSIGKTYQFQTYNEGTPHIPLESEGGLRSSKRNTPVCSVAIVKGERSDPTPEPLGILAILDDGTMWEKVDGVFDEEIMTNSTSRYEGEALEYSYTLKYKYIGSTINRQLLKDIDRWYDEYLKQKAITIRNSSNTELTTADKAQAYQTIDTMNSTIKKVLSKEMIRDKTDSLFLDGKLRVDRANEMKRKDFAKMLSDNIDTDYKVEEASFFEKILAIVIIIIVVVVSWGIGATAAGAVPLLQSAVGIAAFAGSVSIGLSIGMAVLSVVGGMSTQGLVKIIGAFAQIVGYVAMIAGAYAAFQSAVKKALEQEVLEQAGKEGIELTTQQVAERVAIRQATTNILQQATMVVKSAVVNVFDKVTSALTNASIDNINANFINDAIRVISKAVNYWKKHEEGDRQEEMVTIEAENEEYRAQYEDQAIPHPAVVIKDDRGIDMINYVEDKIYEAGPRAHFDKFEASIITLKC